MQTPNAETVRADIPASSYVNDVLIWEVPQSGDNEYSVIYAVEQQIMEGDQSRTVHETYTVSGHVDADGDMVIVRNPPLPRLSRSQTIPRQQQKQTQAWTQKQPQTLQISQYELTLHKDSNWKIVK